MNNFTATDAAFRSAFHGNPQIMKRVALAHPFKVPPFLATIFEKDIAKAMDDRRYRPTAQDAVILYDNPIQHVERTLFENNKHGQIRVLKSLTLEPKTYAEISSECGMPQKYVSRSVSTEPLASLVVIGEAYVHRFGKRALARTVRLRDIPGQ